MIKNKLYRYSRSNFHYRYLRTMCFHMIFQYIWILFYLLKCIIMHGYSYFWHKSIQCISCFFWSHRISTSYWYHYYIWRIYITYHCKISHKCSISHMIDRPSCYLENKSNWNTRVARMYSWSQRKIQILINSKKSSYTCLFSTTSLIFGDIHHLISRQKQSIVAFGKCNHSIKSMISMIVCTTWIVQFWDIRQVQWFNRIIQSNIYSNTFWWCFNQKSWLPKKCNLHDCMIVR